MFDPKLTRTDLLRAPWGMGTVAEQGNPLGRTGNPSDDLRYLTFPWEVDAYMYDQARGVVTNLFWLYDNDARAVADQLLNKISPADEMENAWAQDPVIWRRYMKTLYSVFVDVKEGIEAEHDKDL